MNKKAAVSGITLCALAAFFCVRIAAEEPEQIGIPYLVDAETGKLIPLERQRTNYGMHLKALGFGGGGSGVRYSGKTSPVHVPNKDVRFAIRFASVPPTPSSYVNLDALVSKKDSREGTLTNTGFLGHGAKSTIGESAIELRFLPGHDDVLFFEPVTPLKSGEYVVTTKDGQYGFLFGVGQ